MVIKPRCKKFICINSHPVGCANNVKREIEAASQFVIADRPLNVLVIGSSNGFGLSSRICAAYSMHANTMGIFSSRPPKENKEGTAGWYNSYALARELEKLPTTHVDLNADAFAPDTKTTAIDLIKENFPQGLDLVIYSIAAARRIVGDHTYKSSIRPIGGAVKTLNLDLDTGLVHVLNLMPATEVEIESTRKVMGGEDWSLWIDALNEAGVLKADNKTFAYTYIGSQHTRAVYNDGTIGNAKDHLLKTAREIKQAGKSRAYVISQPAVITQSSSVIPSISLYMTVLMNIYKTEGYDNSIQTHIRNMMKQSFLADPESTLVINNQYELSDEIQAQVNQKWDMIKENEELPDGIGDPEEFRQAFLNMFGFNQSDIDYQADVEHYLV